MASRKRARSVMEADEPPKAPSLLGRLRNFWVFSNLMQFIYLFGTALNVEDDFDIEQLEDTCLDPGPHYKLAEIGLCFLKVISSQRGLTTSDFDEHTRRQYRRRLPEGHNPFGEDETPNRFIDLDVFTQLRILHQLTLWILARKDELRSRMKRKDDENFAEWRCDPCGWDREDRAYFILDDNRLYRRTDPPIPTSPPPKKAKKVEHARPKPKLKAKSKPPPRPVRAGTRTSRRLKQISATSAAEPGKANGDDDDDDADDENELDDEPQQDRVSALAKDGEDFQACEESEATKAAALQPPPPEDYDLGAGYKWECVAVTLQDYHDFLAIIQKSRDANEKNLRAHITDNVLPELEKAEENRQRRLAKRERELANMERLAHAKRSSRIADKVERDREEAEKAALEVKREKDLAAAHADAERKRKMEEARESRTMTREQRLKEREYQKILAEEQLASLSEDNKQAEIIDGRKVSERRIKSEMAKKKATLEALQQQAEEEWTFDCAGCGVYGENLDDGTPIIACEKCTVWQHLACLGISREEADKDDFHFICSDCERKDREEKQREEDAKKPKIAPLKMRFDPSVEQPESPVKRKRGRPRKHALPEDGMVPPPAKKSKLEDHPGDKQIAIESASISGMPPMAKFKVKRTEPKLPNGLHATVPMMNGHQPNQSALPGIKSVFIPFDPVAAGYTQHSKPSPPSYHPTSPAASGYKMFQHWQQSHEPAQQPSNHPTPSKGVLSQNHAAPLKGSPLQQSHLASPSKSEHSSHTLSRVNGIGSMGIPSSPSNPLPNTPLPPNPSKSYGLPPTTHTPVPALSPSQSGLPSITFGAQLGISPTKSSPPVATTPSRPAVQVADLPVKASPTIPPPSSNATEKGFSPTKISPPPPPPLKPVNISALSSQLGSATEMSPATMLPATEAAKAALEVHRQMDMQMSPSYRDNSSETSIGPNPTTQLSSGFEPSLIPSAVPAAREDGKREDEKS